MPLVLREVDDRYPRPSLARSSAGVIRRRRGVTDPRKPADVPSWLVAAFGAPLLVELAFDAAAVLAWWLRLLPRDRSPFEPNVRRALQRLADRHW